MTARDLVRGEQNRAARHVTAVHAGWGGAILSGALAAMVIALGDGRWLDLHPAVPLGLWSVVMAAGLAGSWWTTRALRAAASAGAAARSLEKDRRLRNGSVVGAAELDERDPFVHRAAAAVREAIESSDPDAGTVARRRSRTIRAGLASLTGVVLLGGASSVAPDGWKVVNHPLAAASGDMLSPLVLSGVPRSVLRGSALSIWVQAQDRRWIQVHHRSAGQAWTSRNVRVASGKGVASLGRANSPIWVYASDARGSTDTVLIGVTDKPYLGDVGVEAVYPGYLRRPTEPVEPGAPIAIPSGTLLMIQGRASVPLSEVSISSGGRAVRFHVDGYGFAGSLAPARSGVWSWRASGNGESLTDLPPEIRVELEPDRAPGAEIVSPATDTVVSVGSAPRVLVSATDDHGLAMISLSYWKQSESGQRGTVVSRGANAGNVPIWKALVPLEIPLAPGDEIHVFVTAIDASPWSQRGVSAERIIRVATRADERELARTLADSAVAAAAAAASAQRRLEQQTSAEARARADRDSDPAQNDGSSPRADRARAVAAEQRGLANRVEELRATAEALESSLRAASALDSELAARLQEVRQLLRTALTPALMRSVEELERLQRDPASPGFQDALRDLAAQQRRMREQLERVVEMLRRAAVEGMLQTLADDARELAAAEAAVGESVAELRERSRQLLQNIGAVQNQLRTQQARAGQVRTGNALTDARASIREIEKAPADFRAASDRMSDAADQLAAARSEQIQEWKSELTSDLDLAVQELIQIAREQQALASRVESGAGGNWRPDQASLQQGAATASERVTRAARRSTLISPRSQSAVAAAAQKVARVSAAEIPGGPETAALMRDAAGALNQAAVTLIRDRERTASARSASGFTELLEELQRLAREQGALNGEASALSLQMNAGAATGDRVRALARQQRSIASRLEDVAGSSEGGRAAALADEARRIAERLEAAGLDQNALARQQQLYRRLLDAGRTLAQDERDSTAGRRAERATSSAVLTPPSRATDGQRGFRDPSWAELRGLTAEERQLVIDYFRRINARR